MHNAKYQIGQVIRHTKQDYRGIIVDVDFSFQPQGVHSPITIKKNIASETPWYRILVDNSAHVSYVKETLLLPDEDDYPISHPELRHYLKEINGKYIAQYWLN